MEDYCNIFELKSCNKTGCGIDDNCTVEQWCVNQEENFYCIDKSTYGLDKVTVVLTIQLLRILANFEFGNDLNE